MARRVQRVRRLLDSARVRRAFVKGHNDVGPDFALGLHHRFRREQMMRAVQMTAKFYALFGNVAKVFEAPDLESAAVREHRAVPAHEILYAAHFGHKFRAWAQVQVVRIRENNLRLHFAQVPRRKSLYTRKSAHRHKNRSFDGTMRRMEATTAGLATVACLYKFKGILVHKSKCSNIAFDTLL